MEPRTCGSKTSPTRRSSIRAMRSFASPRPRSAARTCICTMATFPPWSRATSSATSSWARWWRSVRESRISKSATAWSCRSRSPAAPAISASSNLWSLCENSNPNAVIAEKLWGRSPCGIFGYSHMLGGYAGGQAEYARVPFADVGPIKVPDGSADEQVLFLSDIFPTGYMAAENCRIQPGDTVAVWGCGPVGTVRDRERLAARGGARHCDRSLRGAAADGPRASRRRSTLNYSAVDDRRGARRDDRRPRARRLHRCGGHGSALPGIVGVCTIGRSRPCAWRPIAAARCARPFRPVAMAARCRFPVSTAASSTRCRSGSFVNRALTLKSGQTHVQRYLRPLLERIQKGEIDPSFVITHRLALDEAPQAYEIFKRQAGRMRQGRAQARRARWRRVIRTPRQWLRQRQWRCHCSSRRGCGCCGSGPYQALMRARLPPR